MRSLWDSKKQYSLAVRITTTSIIANQLRPAERTPDETFPLGAVHMQTLRTI
jgi:hypothetical protein